MSRYVTPRHRKASSTAFIVVGSIAGPFIDGLLLPRLSGGQRFLAAAGPLLVVAGLALALRMAIARPVPDHGRFVTE